MDHETLRKRALSRRSFLLGMVGVTSASLLAACGGGGATTGGAATSAPAAGGATSAPAPASTTASAAQATTAPAVSTPAAPAGGATAPAAGATAPAGEATTAPVAGATAAPGATTAAAGSTPAAGGAAMTKDTAPKVTNADQAKQYSGQQITYYGDSVGIGAEVDQTLAKQFTADTGINVNVVPKPESATEAYSAYQRFFQASSADVDVMMVDVIWPGAFAPHLLDLTSTFTAEAANHYPGIIENNTIDGKLVAIPWFGDFGMLFYRKDLLEKNGISAPPKTWDELGEQALKVVEAEKGANANIVGYVFQGNAYEGLTCNALEWLASSGGGRIVEDGKVTLNNPQAIETLNKAKGWIGTAAPRGVTSYQEEDARNTFQGGNSVFMRNWPYAYAAGNADDSPIKGKFDVAPLPAASGQRSAGTVGGWQLAVSKYSKSPDASTEFVRYMTSTDVQTWRAVVGSYVPTIGAVAENAQVLEVMPFLKTLADVERVTRPSATAGQRYNELSTAFFQGVNQVLNGADAAQVVPQTAQRIERIIA